MSTGHFKLSQAQVVEEPPGVCPKGDCCLDEDFKSKSAVVISHKITTWTPGNFTMQKKAIWRSLGGSAKRKEEDSCSCFTEADFLQFGNKTKIRNESKYLGEDTTFTNFGKLTPIIIYHKILKK